MTRVADIKLVPLFGWALTIATVLSTQFLAQPFVWRSWAADQIFTAWLGILGDRVLVAVMIALAIAAVSRLRADRPRRQAMLLALAMVVGATLGETLLAIIDPFGDYTSLTAFVRRVARWSLIASALAGLFLLWRRGAEYRARAAQIRIDAIRARQILVAGELEILRRQIEPHFLFNTLATIQGLRQTSPDQGRHVLARLCDFMAASFAQAKSERSTLGDELDIVAAYLDVCAARMGGRLRMTIDAPAALRACAFPPLMLATLIENAIKHGLAPLAEGGSVEIKATVQSDSLEVVVADDGAGISGQGGSGIGLANLVARLRVLYGDRASFQLQANAPRGARAIIRVPHVPVA